jgi:hypothetical protein
MKLRTLLEQQGNVYASTTAEDGEFIGVVGPFKTAEAAHNFFEQPEFDTIQVDIEDVMSPEDYLETFIEDE